MWNSDARGVFVLALNDLLAEWRKMICKCAPNKIENLYHLARGVV